MAIKKSDISIDYDGHTFYAHGNNVKKYKAELRFGGFRYQSKQGRFQTRNIFNILRLKHIPLDFDINAPPFTEMVEKAKEKDLENMRKRQQAEREEEERFKSSDALAPSPDFKVKTPADIHLFSYQQAGVEQLLKRKNCLLADDMGLGKTVQVITAINHFEKIKQILIICPPSMIITWLREWHKFTIHDDLTVAPLTTKTPVKELSGYNILIAGYSIFSREYPVTKALCERKFNLLVLDEAHYCKNYKAKRTMRILGERGKGGLKAPKKWMLTGTPMLNRPMELYPLVHKLARPYFPDFWEFAFDFTEPEFNGWGWDLNGACNLDELRERLKMSCMVRRTKEEVLTELPPKTQQMITLSPTSAEEKRALKKETKVRKTIAEKQKINAAINEKIKNLDPNKKGYYGIKRRLEKGKLDVPFQLIPLARHETARAKLPQDLQVIRDVLENTTKKLIVFAHHKDVMKHLTQELSSFHPVLLTGDMTVNQRMNVIDTFQKDPQCRLFVGSILAASEGITLTAASHVIFCEIEWSPAKMNQAEDRAHRIGQHENLLVQYLVLDGSYDANMLAQLLNKKDVIDAVMNHK